MAAWSKTSRICGAWSMGGIDGLWTLLSGLLPVQSQGIDILPWSKTSLEETNTKWAYLKFGEARSGKVVKLVHWDGSSCKVGLCVLELQQIGDSSSSATSKVFQ